MVHIQKEEKAELMPQMNIGIYQLAIPVSLLMTYSHTT